MTTETVPSNRDLRPCAHCGSRAEYLASMSGFIAMCQNCLAKTGPCVSYEEARRKWNKRVPCRKCAQNAEEKKIEDSLKAEWDSELFHTAFG